MSTHLSSRVALITGGGTGIGAAIAHDLAKEGVAVVISGRRNEVVEETATAIRDAGGRALAVSGDVRRADDARAMVAATVETFGALHILVNNAGIARGGPVDAATEDDIDALFDINVKGPIHMMRAALTQLRGHRERGGASVVNISSSVTQTVLANYSIYTATKAAVDQLTRCWALDHAADRIRINAVLPGLIRTPIFDTMMDAEAVSTWLDTADRITPLGRIGQGDDIARMVRFLVDPANDWITGGLFTIDGGISTAGNV
ncbi:MAG: SDR family oxidoreductase [Acidobacteriota bacterium]